MSKKADYEAKVAALSEPLAAEIGLELVDVELVRESDMQILRVLLDKKGGIMIDECEELSRLLDPLITQAGLMEDIDSFEVSSPGLDRPLKKEADFIRHMGEEVDVGLYKARDGEKTLVGTLTAYEKGNLTLTIDGEPTTVMKSEIAVVKQHLDF